MKKITFLFFAFIAFSWQSNAQTTVTCGTPENVSGVCYTNSTNEEWSFIASDNSQYLTITVNAGQVENSYDEFQVYDGADATATQLYSGYGSVGDLTGLTFTSSGSELFVRITPDFSTDCAGSGYTPLDFDVVCSPPPTCLEPSGMTASNVTATSADLSWTAGDSETQWQLEWNADTDFTPGTGTSGGSAGPSVNPTYTAMGLTPDTTYYIYYRADCGGGDTSDWAGPFTGTTLVSCPAPTALSAILTSSTSADLSWTLGDSETMWNIEWGVSPFSQGAGTPVNGVANPYSLTTLTADTAYQYYVQADCGGGDTSVWVGPFDFYTGYCISVPSSNDNSGISNVQIGTTDFVGSDVTYLDFTGTPVDLSQGISNNVQITFMTNFTYDTHIWIDLNDDLVFDNSTELFYSGESPDSNTGTDLLDASFVVPAAATLGAHRMRIGTADSGQSTANPCYNGSFGVTVDLDVNIIVASCSPPVATATVSPDCGNTQFYVDVDVTDLGDGTPEITDGTSTWAIAGLGVTQVGPFVDASSVSLTVSHGSDVTCNLSLGAFAYTCPPDNDECSAAIGLTVNADYDCGTVTSGTINGATDSGVDNCGGTEDDDVWYSFVADYTEHRVSLINIAGSTTDMYHAVYDSSGGCGSLGTALICNDGNTSNLTGLVIGNTYYVQVYTWTGTGGQTSTFDVCVGTPSTETLEYYNLQWPASGTITDGDGHNVYAQCYEAGLTDVTSGQAPGVECWIGYSSTDTDPSGAGWTWVTAAFDSESGNNDQYILDLDASVGVGTYYYAARWSQNVGPYTYGGIQADGSYGGVWGIDNNISGMLTVNAPPPPANDDCANATTITMFNNGDSQDASSATNNDGFITDCGSGMNDGVWYTFNVIDAGTIDVAISGVTGWDPELAVYSGSCGVFTCTTSADSGGSGSGESVSFAATANTQYWVNIGYWSNSTDNAEGPLTINVSTTDTATLDTTLDVIDSQLTDFKYFPNPVEGTLSLRAQENMQNVAVYNMLGQEVINISPNAMSNDLDMSALSRGAYFVRVSINGAIENFKIIKK